jgi:hypothetical protein
MTVTEVSEEMESLLSILLRTRIGRCREFPPCDKQEGASHAAFISCRSRLLEKPATEQECPSWIMPAILPCPRNASRECSGILRRSMMVLFSHVVPVL